MVGLLIVLLFISLFLLPRGYKHRGITGPSGPIVSRGGKGFIQEACERQLEEFYDTLEDGAEMRTFTFDEFLKNPEAPGKPTYWNKAKRKFEATK